MLATVDRPIAPREDRTTVLICALDDFPNDQQSFTIMNQVAKYTIANPSRNVVLGLSSRAFRSQTFNCLREFYLLVVDCGEHPTEDSLGDLWDYLCYRIAEAKHSPQVLDHIAQAPAVSVVLPLSQVPGLLSSPLPRANGYGIESSIIRIARDTSVVVESGRILDFVTKYAAQQL